MTTQPYRQGGRPEGKPIIEDNYNHISKAQINYIEILSNKLGMGTVAKRNAHILSVTKRNFDNDIYLLSMAEGCQVIATFRKWLAEREAGE